MSSSSRQKRPELDRFGPIRRFGGALGSIGDGGGSAEGRPGRDASTSGTVSRAVELGYSVIEEYIRQGQAFARTAGPQRGPGEPSAPDPRRLTERMYQYASDLAAVWLEYAQTTMSQAPPPGASSAAPGSRPAAPHVGGFDIGSETAPARSSTGPDATGRPSLDPPGVSVDIVSTRRVEVTVELKPGSVHGALCAHDLRPGDPQLPRISGVTIDPVPSENRVIVRLKVPDDRPAATYTGLIVDAVSNLPQGTLSVRVFA
jgi:hypothetical protein